MRPVDIVSDKQTFKAPTIIKVGDKEVVKARPFTRLETTLTMTPTGFADAVPPFNPLKITNGGTDVAEAPPDPGPVQDNAEVTFRVEDLTPSDAEQTSGELTQAEAEAQVVETLKAPADAQKAASQSLPPQILLMRTSRAGEALRELSAYATVGSVSPEHALRLDRSAHDSREREQCGQGKPRRRVSEREARSNAPWRELRGRAQGQWRKP